MKNMYISDINNNNHCFAKIDKKKLAPLFKKAIKVMQSSAPRKLTISELMRQMLAVSKKTKSKSDLIDMEELLYFVIVAERMK